MGAMSFPSGDGEAVCSSRELQELQTQLPNLPPGVGVAMALGSGGGVR